MAMDAVVQVPLYPLSCGLLAVVDAADYPLISGERWYRRRNKSHRTTYAFTNINGRPVYMHRLLMGDPPGLQVDHKDRNGLNNTRDNLRPCTRSQNQQNREASRFGKSRFKGVSWLKHRSRWRATIMVAGRQQSLGLYDTEEAAARAFDEAALRLHGEYARLNFPITEGAAQ